MATNLPNTQGIAPPGGMGLPIAQTLAGLFGGLVQARNMQMQNPRWGFSKLPILGGGLSGLAEGLAGLAARNEQLRQEQRGNQDALAQYALQSGQTVADIQRNAGGLPLKGYQSDVGGAIGAGVGNQAVASSLGIKNPNSFYGVDKTLANTIFGNAQKQLQDQGTTNALETAQAAGLNDAGGNQTGNSLMFPTAPSLASLVGPTMTALGNGANGATNVPGGRWQSMPGGKLIQQLQAQQQGIPQLQPTMGGVMQGQVNRAMPSISISDLGASPQAAPRSLADLALQSVDPKTLVSQYGQSADAAAARNNVTGSMYNTAQTQSGENQRAIAGYAKPTEASIIQNGEPGAFGRLMKFQEAGVKRAQSLFGLEKPATRGEINASMSLIDKQGDRSGVITAAQLAVRQGTLTPEEALSAANSSNGDTSNPITLNELLGNTTSHLQQSALPNPQATAPTGPQQVYSNLNAIQNPGTKQIFDRLRSNGRPKQPRGF